MICGNKPLYRSIAEGSVGVLNHMLWLCEMRVQHCLRVLRLRASETLSTILGEHGLKMSLLCPGLICCLYQCQHVKNGTCLVMNLPCGGPLGVVGMW